MRVSIVSTDRELVALIRSTLGAAVQDLTIEVATTARDALANAAGADSVILDLDFDDPPGGELLRRIRSDVDSGALIAIAPSETAGWTAGASDAEAIVGREGVSFLLAPVLEAALGRRGSPAAVSPTAVSPGAEAEADVPDADQRLNELLRVAGRVQHEINNPLAALLAEAQLLGLEPTLAGEHHTAVERIVELIRRVIGIVRKLDEVRGETER